LRAAGPARGIGMADRRFRPWPVRRPNWRSCTSRRCGAHRRSLI